MGHGGQNSGALCQRHAQRQSGAQHIQRIIYHKTAGNANPYRYFFLFFHHGERNVIRLETDVLRPQIRLCLLGVGELAAGGMGHEPGGPGVVGIIDAGVAPAEQLRLRVAVVFHGLVEIQVVLGQIGEHAHGVVDAVDPVQRQGMGGDLHNNVGAAGIPHAGKQALELEGLRRGALGGHHLAADHVLVGADEAHLGACRLLQNGLEQIGGGGLAVGAGDTHHGHGVGGVAIEVGAQHGQGPAAVFRAHPGNALFRSALTQHRRRAGRDGLGDEVVSVHGKAGHGHEQVSGLGGAGVIADAGNFHIQVRRGIQHGDPFQKRAQFHLYLLLTACLGQGGQCPL